MKIFKSLFTLLLVIISSTINAGNIDLVIETNLEPVNSVEFLQIFEVNITLTNNGPDIAGGESTSNFPISVHGPSIENIPGEMLDFIFIKNNAIPQRCFFIDIFASPLPGGIAHIVNTLAFPQILPNSSITCYARLQIGFNNGVNHFNFQVLSSLDIDSDLSNNISIHSFRIKPRIIPVLDGKMLVLLITLLLLFSGKKLIKIGLT